MTKIKICGLKRICDIDFVNEGKPDYAGFIINVPQSRRNVTPETVRALKKRLCGAVIPVGVFVDSPMEDILSLAEDGVIRAVQLHGNENAGYVRTLREKLNALNAHTHIPVIQAFKISSPADFESAEKSSADFILLDNGGGTGVPFDWSFLKETGRPFFLAGGLTPENLAQAVKTIKPYAVDMSSGVENENGKDREKILAAIAAVRSC